MITTTVVTASLYPEYGATIQHVGDRDIQRIGPYTKRRPLSHAPTAAESKPAPKVKPDAAPTDRAAKLERLQAKSLKHQQTATPDLPARAGRQVDRVFEVMKGGEWFTLPELCALLPDIMMTSLSARIRDLDGDGKGFREEFNIDRVDEEEIRRGLHRYRLIMRPEATDADN